jgi:hypothetical protein
MIGGGIAALFKHRVFMLRRFLSNDNNNNNNNGYPYPKRNIFG